MDDRPAARTALVKIRVRYTLGLNCDPGGATKLARATLMFCLLGTALLAGCDKMGSTFQSAPISTTTVEGKTRSARRGGEEVRVWRDPDTGCEYLLWERRQRGSMTPRLKPDGRPMCRF